MNSKQVTIGLADDHVLFRKGIAELINDTEGFEVVMEASDGEELLQHLKSRQTLPEVILMDIKMPRLNGYDTCRKLKESYHDIKVLALSMYDDESAVIRMIRAGANGYILKDAHPSELKTAIRQLVEKGHYYSELMSSAMMQNIRTGNKEDLTSLNDREIEFLSLAASELTYKEIADKMN